jgi:3-dehydroquinate synthase
MKKIKVPAARYYEVHIGSGLLAETGKSVAKLVTGRVGMIISDDNVFPLYGGVLENSLRLNGFDVKRFIIPHGESSKNSAVLIEVLNCMASEHLSRSDVVFALGGGVVGDLAGLASGLYMRGVCCIQLPTTILSAVDSSVGGKTAVNLLEGKNLMGLFSQPRLVLCDTDCMKTLPDHIWSDGFAEVIKYAMIRSTALLTNLGSADEQELEEIIAQCVSIKRDVVVKDEYDLSDRQLLNFGHTVGHAVESLSGFQISHGSAVAIGMSVITRGCAELGYCPKQCVTVLERLIDKYKLPDSCSYSPSEIVDRSRADKKRDGDKINLVLPDSLGHCVVVQSDFDLLGRILEAGMQ